MSVFYCRLEKRKLRKGGGGQGGRGEQCDAKQEICKY